MKVERGKKVDWAQIICNSLCSELDWWYKYVKENKGDKKDTCESTLKLANFFKYMFIHQKENPQKPQAKVKKTREKMQTTLVNKRKVVAKFPRSVLKRKNRAKEGGAPRLRAKKEQENIEAQAHKMMRGKVAPSVVLALVQATR